MFKRLFLIFIIIGVLAFSKSVKAFNLCQGSKAFILIESETGKIINEGNKDLRLPMASMTKVMSLAIIYDAISNHKISLDTNITTSTKARMMGGSQVYLEEGETYPLKEMLKCICIASANDAMVAVAEAIYATEENFVAKMNEKALELKMTNTHYADSTGLSNDNHYTSAFDMSIISNYLLKNYPEVLAYTKQREAYFRENTAKPFWLVNTNKLVGKVDGVDGLKTGWTNKSGYCITVSAKRNNMRLIGVLMGYEKPTTRNIEAVELLNYGFTNFEKKLIAKKGKIIYEINDLRYNPQKFKVVLKNDLYTIVERGSQELEIGYEIKKHPNYYENKAGIISIYYGEDYISDLDFYAEENIKKRSFIDLWLAIIKYFFK